MIVTRDGVFFYVSLNVLLRSSNFFGQLLTAPTPPIHELPSVPVSTLYFSDGTECSAQPLPSPPLSSDTPDPNLDPLLYLSPSHPSSPLVAGVSEQTLDPFLLSLLTSEGSDCTEYLSQPLPWRPIMSGISEPKPEPTLLNLFVSERSDVLNVILHVLYGMPVARHAPSLETLGEALACLEKYGIGLPDINSDVWTLLLRHARSQPLRAYAIAASHAVEPVCVSASQFTLNVSLSTLSEGDALIMGCIYLRRLTFLHLGRRDALKRVVSEPPARHTPTSTCSKRHQESVERAWNVGVADILVRNMPHNMPVDALIEAFGPVVNVTHCEICREHTRERISRLLAEWLAIKRTI